MPDGALHTLNENGKSVFSRSARDRRRSFADVLHLSWFDTTTKLIPDHGHVLEACFLLGGVGAVAAAAIALLQWKKLAVPQRIVWPPVAALSGFLFLFLFSSEAASLVEYGDHPSRLQFYVVASSCGPGQWPG